MDCQPFPHCIIKNFLSSETFVENLQKELRALNFHEKSNDLYKFKQVFIDLHTDCQSCCTVLLSYYVFLFVVVLQSDDLKKRKEPHIAGLR